MKRKLCSHRGMTLSEMLVATAVASLVALAVAVGVSSAIRVYHQSVEFSDTQVLFSTLSQAVADELRYARDVSSKQETGGDWVLTSFTSMNYGTDCLLDSNDAGQLVVRSASGDAADGQLLVGSGVYSGGAFKAKLEPVVCLHGAVYEVQLTVTDKNDRELKSGTIAVAGLN